MNRRSNQLVLFLVVFVAALVLVIWLKSLQHHPSPDAPSGPETSVHLTMGNPSGATADVDNPDNYLMRKPYFALAYNNAKGTPNWVSWCLKQDDLGPAPRVDFYPDPDLPRTFKHVVPRDYSGSGFDRGHMCPRSDRSSTPEAATATFVMTNIIPQSPACNQKAWADFEEYCRNLAARKRQTLYIVSGPQGQGGEGTKGAAEAIAGGKVTVPAKCWKVVLVIDDGTCGPDDIARVNSGTRLIAVVMPNDQTVGHGWAKYRTSAKEVEGLTGYRFFDRVPADVIDPLKDKMDREHIPPSRPRRTED